jgi:hypothetical protein
MAIKFVGVEGVLSRVIGRLVPAQLGVETREVAGVRGNVGVCRRLTFNRFPGRFGIRIEAATLMFFDIDTRELLRTRPNPLAMGQVGLLRGARAAGPPPRPSSEPVTVQRRPSNTGVVMVCGQKVALGRSHRYETVTIHVAETTLAVEVGGETRVVRRTTSLPVRNIKADRPRTASGA